MDPLTFLCLASYEKGHDFLREAKRQGARVFLITSQSLQNTAQWPRESLDDIFYMPDRDKNWNRGDTLLAISHLARTHANRPGGGAGRFRPGDGCFAARTSADSRNGGDHHPLLPR